MAIGGVRMVRSAEIPTEWVITQAALASAGSLGDSTGTPDQPTSRQATFTNLEAAVAIIGVSPRSGSGWHTTGWLLGQVSRAVRLMQQAITKLQGSAGDVFDIFDPCVVSRGDTEVGPTGVFGRPEVARGQTPPSPRSLCEADRCGRALARGSCRLGASGVSNALDGIGGQLAQVRESAAGIPP